MKYLSKFLLSVCVALLLAAPVSTQDLLPTLVRNIKPSAVAIETFDANGKSLSRGSGFFVAVDRVITNRHVIERSARVQIQLSNGQRFRASGILAIDREGDLALLAVNVPRSLATPLPLLLESPEEGESIVVIGNPYGLEGSVSNGIVSAVREIPGYGQIIQITAPISPGSSGSPVVNMRGQVIGVATLQAEEGQSLNFAVPSERISRLRISKVRAFSAVSREASQNKRAIAERLYSKGLQLLSNDDFARALPYFKEAVKSDPAYAEAWYQVGFCYGMLKKHEEALEASRTAARLRPEWSETWTNIGASSFAIEEYEEAAIAYKKAAALDPNNGDLQYALGLSYDTLGRLPEAVLGYRRAILIQPDHADAIESLGKAYMKQKRYKQAIKMFESLQSYRIDANSYHLIGLSYLMQGKTQKSIDAFINAINMNTSFDEARFNLGEAYLKEGDRDLARHQYEILQALGSEWADRLLAQIDP